MTQLRVHTLKVLKLKVVEVARVVCFFLAASAGLALPAAAATFTFSNTNAITIPASGPGPGSGPADPYPSVIEVSGITAPITKVTVTLTGFTHSFPNDVGALLVGPGGQATVLFNGPASGFGAVDLIWTFDDGALGPLPSSQTLPIGEALSSGTFTPSSYFPDDSFDFPAPASPYPDMLSVFNGLSGASANGDWKLYIQDFVGGDSGSLSGGWSLTITTVSSVPEPTSLALIGLALAAYAARRRRPTTAA